MFVNLPSPFHRWSSTNFCFRHQLLNTLYQQSQVAAPQFAVKISPSGSLITLGGYNASSIKGQPTWTPVTNQAYWSVRGYVWPNSAINSTQYDFIVDTGASSLFLIQPTRSSLTLHIVDRYLRHSRISSCRKSVLRHDVQL